MVPWPTVVPGTQPIEADLAESWSQPNDTTYVFKLRKGVRWQAWEPHVKNFSPNIGHDYGGRLMAAWLDR